MVEESKEKPSSQQKASEEEKKPQAPAPQPPRPAAVPPPAPPKPQQPASSSRRNFVKALFTIGAILSVTPFVPWGSFLSSSVAGGGKRYLLQKLKVDNNLTKYGTAAGKQVNVNDLSTFPANGHWVVTYPSSGDLTVDAQNPDTFQKYELIRLPGAAGSTKSATDFVAFSKVCVHLWCSPNYNPASGHQQYECPCHGSIYRIPDGKAIEGPASIQPSPTNAIPMLTLQADSSGDLYAFYPNYDPSTKKGVSNSIEADGDLGYGRDFNSYQSFLKPSAQILADPKDLTTQVS